MANQTTANVVVTVDIVVIRPGKEASYEILLIQRGKDPFVGLWALPGGKLAETDITLESAAHRELQEETGLTVPFLAQFHSYGNAGRDPRGRYVSIAFLAPLREYASVRAGDDASKAAWFPVSQLPSLAFDHLTMIQRAGSVLALHEGGYETPIGEAMAEEKLMEKLADQAHASWSHWMQCLFTQSEKQTDGSVVIPPNLAARWQQQMGTPYARLSEQEKTSDRELAAALLPIIREAVNG